ncbi:MAG: hypothetical protein N4A45_09595 [Flavobacteriales bacterium]|jgi:hypothetical protein|nr:hypothetical protein [Flavobacteriales bacterium]
MNPIKRVIQSRIIQLLAQSESISKIKHPPTVGELRESFIVNFLKDLLPKRISLNTGVICDATGNISRQLDLILTDESYLPKINFGGRNSIIPVESVLMFAEVKSTLSTLDLEQIEEQIKGMYQLKLAKYGASNPDEKISIHGLVIAFDCNIKEETLEEWLNDNKGVLAICIIDKYSMLRTKSRIQIIRSKKEIKFDETLSFIGALYQALELQISKREFVPNWHTYLSRK